MTRSITSKLALFAVAAGFAMPAAAEMKFENGSGGSVLLYGQFDPGYLSFDDGVTTTSELVDNTNSNSRVGLWVRQQYGENLFTFNFETALGFRPSAGLSQNFTPKGVNWQRTNIRKVDFALKTPRYGTFSAGQGSMATDGAAEVDLSGTSLVTYVSIPDTSAAFQFRTSAGALSGKSIGGAFGDFDGGRLGRVRYDTPSFNGFTVSAAYGDNILATNVTFKTSDIALRYAGDAGDFKLKGAVGYKHVELAAGVTFNDTIGSFSVLHASGFNATIAAGNRSTNGDYGYGKLGYRANWFDIGETALSVDYYRANDRVSAGSTSTSYGFGAVQKFDKYRVEAYLGYRTYQLTETAASYQDASSVLFGARLKF
ncbi:MAG: porin [Rhodobacteraceae bacterium]|nr:MAG: porin [Paracoccaceae bacterium]